ncbi:MAG: heme biosynthesis HemY N-terminal domain-containing protein [Halioglobus sp.]
MRKIFIYSLIGLLLGVAVVALIEIDPGYVLVAYGNYTVETSLWVGSLVLLLFTAVVYLSVRLLRRVLGGKSSISSWLGGRKTRQGVHLTNRGLINFIEGNWSKSRRQLLRGAKGNEAPLLNYLIAARASYQLNEADKMREYLGAAEDSETDAGVAVEITQAEMKLGAQQYEQALATLVRARRNAGRHPHVLSLLRKVYEGLKDWQSLADLLPELRKYKVVPENELSELERQVHTELFQLAASTDTNTDGLKKHWAKVPTDLQKPAALGQVYLRLLIERGAHEEAAKIIVRSLKQAWSSELANLYGYVALPNLAKQLAQAESWLATHEKDAQLQLCLGRLSARNQLWGKARDYFENSYKLERSAETCAELGRLLAGLGEERVSAAYFREGLLLKESGLPELPMPDKAVSRARRLANA